MSHERLPDHLAADGWADPLIIIQEVAWFHQLGVPACRWHERLGISQTALEQILRRHGHEEYSNILRREIARTRAAA